jgi:hypothetical protein
MKWFNRFVFAIGLIVLAAGAASAIAGDLPDPKLTPGVTRPDLTVEQICKTKWGKDARAVTEAMKREVLQAYHMTAADCPSGKIEIDHLCSRELGCADDVKNLWPQCYEKPVAGLKASETKEWGAHKKDRLENRLHKEVCDGTTSLDDARHEIITDWIAAYKRRFGTP